MEANIEAISARVDVQKITDLPAKPMPIEVVEPTKSELLVVANRSLAWAAGEDLLRKQGLVPEEYVIDAEERDGEWFVTYRSRTQYDEKGNVIL